MQHPEHLARLIVDDHAKARAHISHLAAGRGDRGGLVEVLGHDLALHAGAEEIVAYPALRDLPGNGERRAEGALEDHQTLKDLLATLHRAEPGEYEFEIALGQLLVEVQEHMAREEAEVLPRLTAGLGDDRMVELGRQFTAVKLGLPTRAHPKAPDTPPANLAAGALATLDKARDRLSGRQKAFASDHSGLLDVDAQALVDAFGALLPKPIELLTPEIARRQPTIADAVASLRRSRGESTDREPVGLVVNRIIPGPRGKIPLRIYSPETAGHEAAPVIVYVHGGGWVLANLDVYDATPRALVNQTGAVVVSVGYRKAPEQPFPAGHDDVLAATEWVLDHTAAVGGDRNRIAIAGEGAGATMAAATAWHLLHAGDRRLRFQLLVYPGASGERATLSYEDSADAVPLNRAMIGWFFKHAFADPAHALDPRVDLVGIPLERLDGLPPALVITAERDPLRAEGEAFAQRLADAGVEVSATRYEGMPHGFFGTGAVVETARHAVFQAAGMLNVHLGTAAPAWAGRR